MNLKTVLIYVYLCMFIYLFQIHSIYVYAYVNMLVIRSTAPPPVNLMFLGEHAFFNCVTETQENGLTSAEMDM